MSVEKYLPHSFVFVIVLTVVAYLLALILTPTGPFAIITEWYGEFWSFLTFAMQMTLIIVTGYAIASAPLVRRLLRRLAHSPNSSSQGYLSIVLVGAAFSYFNWGLGMVVGAFFAITLTSIRDDIDFGFAIAAGYMGIWPGIVGSLSVTAPLLVNTPEHFIEDQIGIIPLTETLFSPLHLSVVVGTLLIILILVYLMRPRAEQSDALSDEQLGELLPKYENPEAEGDRQTFAESLNQNRIFSAVFVLMAGSYIIYLVITEGLITALGLNSMNFILLTVGLALHGNPISYVNAVGDGVERAAQVILQFPFYGGIQGILVGTGLSTVFVNGMTDLATTTTYPFFVFLSTGVLNIFVPSAGGQYIVMADILHSSAANLGVADATVVTAYTVGDGWTNMFQPFWALPILGIAGLEIRDIWGYVLVGLIGFGVVAGGIFLLFPVLGLI